MTFVFQNPAGLQGGGGNGFPITGTTTTSDDTETPIVVVNLDEKEGDWFFDFRILAYNQTDQEGLNADAQYCFRTTATTATEIAPATTIYIEDAGMIDCEVLFLLSQNPNILTVLVQGLPGKTIDWLLVGSSQFVG